MPLIFDRFPDLEHAEDFVAAVDRDFSREARAFETDDCCSGKNLRSDEPGLRDCDATVFPVVVDPPIVLVSRNHDKHEEEDKIIELAASFGGAYAGT